jgi:hypothetical protein
MDPKRLDDVTTEELASLDFEGDKRQDVDGEPLQKVKAALKIRIRTGVRAGRVGFPPAAMH